MPHSRIHTAQTTDEIAAVKEIFLEYIDFIEAYLGQSLGFQKTDSEFETFPAVYDQLFLALLDDVPVGACGLKPFAPSICELKRLYIRPEGRGHNLGERLTRSCFKAAKTLGYEQIYLDTDPGLTHANAIYERLGFQDIERYYDNPMGCSRFMSRPL